MNDILNTNGSHDGLPLLLSYKLKQEGSEILIADAGISLDKWGEEKMDRRQRMDFAIEMLKQIIPALKKLHDLGFSHGDIKHENICARYDRNG